MSLPQEANNSCDIYRVGNAPPAAPDVAGVSCFIIGNYSSYFLDQGEAAVASLRFTHLMLVDTATDIRDDWNAGSVGANQDSVYIPNKNGTQLVVVFVERVNKNALSDHKRVYLLRKLPTWPTNDV